MEFQARAYGKYFLLDKLATGGMAEVFKAKTFGVQGFERLLVIKQILPHLTKDREFVEMFIDEAKISVELSHANIVQVFDLGKIGSNYFIAMEYIDGKDLRAILKKATKEKTPIPTSLPVYICGEILKGLDYAHKKRDSKTNEPLNIIHRDISPQNVVLSYDGEVKIVDFGIAKAERRLNETQAGVLKGKFGYMSPEQTMGQEIDHRSDLFACGILLYEMLTARRLFMGENDLETLELIRDADIPPIRNYNPDVPEELERILLKALQRDPDERFADARSMLLELNRFMFEYNPEFTSSDLSAYLNKVFEKEIIEERSRLQKALEALERKYKVSKGDHSGGQVTGLVKEVSFVHGSDSEVTEADPGSLRNQSSPSSQPSKTESYGGVSQPSAPSGRYAHKMADQQTVFQAKPSGSIRADYTDDPSIASSRNTPQRSNLRPWVVPIVLLVCVLGLVYMNFFRSGSGNKSGKTADTVEPIKKGLIGITSEPPGAEIYVGDVLRGSTPVSLELAAEKDQFFTFRLEGYEEKSMALFLIAGENEPLSVVLQRSAASLSHLRVTSVPAGAQIFIDGADTGQLTPFTFSELDRGRELQIRLYHKGYHRQDAAVVLDAADVEKNFDLQARNVRLSIVTEPEGAAIKVNGKLLGDSPTRTKVKMNQIVKIVANKKGYQPQTREVNITDANERVKLVLQPVIIEYGYLSINADPWATVYIDGELTGNTPLINIKIPIGSHVVEFQHEEFKNSSQQVVVTKSHTKESPLVLIKAMEP